MRIVFLGTPQFAVPSLEALIAAGYEVALVVTQPDRPRGRGQSMAQSAVKECAVARGIEVFQPERVRRPEGVERLAAVGAEMMVVVGYGQIIPQSILDMPRLGILNVHASLLPLYRGAAPVQWAIANGERVTGVTIMKIDAGLDTGDVLTMAKTVIGPEETAVELGARLAVLGAGLLVDTIAAYAVGMIAPRAQDHALATLAPILKKDDGRIDWNWPAQRVHDRVRGFQPWPGGHTTFRGQVLNLWKTRITDGALGEGVLRRDGRRLLAGCGEGTAVELIEVQGEGKKRMPGSDFANGARLADNEVLGS